MRIVGGKWGGRAIEAPEGRGVTRPTTDRMRESMASMILSAAGLDLSGKSVLDAFAGSGAMGLELVSRGAASATFVDKDRGAAARIKRTSRTLGAAPSEVAVVTGDVFQLASSRLAHAPFGIVFLDPPYAFEAERVSSLVDSLASSGQLAPGAVVVYEHSAAAPGLACEGLVAKKTKKHGITAVDLYIALPKEEEA